jgi:DNA-binding MarR family transcriptional regulator
MMTGLASGATSHRGGSVPDGRYEALAITIAESRGLFSVRRPCTPDIGQVAETLGLDVGYVSRLVSRGERAGRLRLAPAEDDRRRRVVSLTAKRRRLLGAVEQRSNDCMDALAAHLRPSQVKELLEAMETIRRLLILDGAS